VGVVYLLHDLTGAHFLPRKWLVGWHALIALIGITCTVKTSLPSRMALMYFREMKCPKCNAELQPQKDRGVAVEACPSCQGMWLTPAELDELENEAFADEANKGSLYVVSHETKLKCPVCSAALKRFNYRFFDLELDCCPEHGFWLDKDEDRRILQLITTDGRRGEKARKEVWDRGRLGAPYEPSAITELLRQAQRPFSSVRRPHSPRGATKCSGDVHACEFWRRPAANNLRLTRRDAR
jgi:Zn-finger nucleic acid-binding protein